MSIRKNAKACPQCKDALTALQLIVHALTDRGLGIEPDAALQIAQATIKMMTGQPFVLGPLTGQSRSGQAFKAGQAAFMSGHGLDANPYAEDERQELVAWLTGWKIAQTLTDEK